VAPDNTPRATGSPVNDPTPGDLGDALRGATARLRDAGSPTPRLDAELLLAHVLDRERSWLLAHPEAPLGSDHAQRFATAVARRATGEPVAYIRGFKEWRSLRIRTDARALIPRPETELLLEAAVAELAARLTRNDAPIVAWEVATGSGAVAVAMAIRFREALKLGRLTLVASDASPEALELAAENLAAHGVEHLVQLACADLLAPAGTSLPRPDVVVANLPYVPTAEVAAAGGSLDHEPRLALDGGADGLEVIRRLLAGLPRRAAPRATALLEIGAGQADLVRAMAPRVASVATSADLAGIERVVRIGLAD
jgi:release factor glutamine methyltransferase